MFNKPYYEMRESALNVKIVYLIRKKDQINYLENHYIW